MSRSDSTTFLVPHPPSVDKSVTHAAESGQSCAACFPLTVGDGDCVDRDTLLSSQNGGCTICSFFITAITTAVGSTALWKHASTWIDKGILGLTIAKTEPYDSSCVAVLAINGESGPSPFAWIPTLAKSPYSRTFARDLCMIEEWIQECQQNHPHCQQLSTPTLPTRVIDVGGGGRDPCLVHSQGRAGQYLALSHRWGDPTSHVTKLVTMKENISQHYLGIPLANIPATFRDAIIVARHLRIPYVWIDSLCIVQDDRED
ncbi:uncharacterized protein C8A04DRAFT_25575 [Dichotomopilus funicola]|uniref:Heterokaryon incompatibility domain-containing protein n=1 Tax=Dichotomopilus funicola TaxID=1934379 RepID=A0AAN6V9U8_9PEZI|nr:hypothetical protein C8A04DRAFT_25575 [Dichotomopilus funicola]